LTTGLREGNLNQLAGDLSSTVTVASGVTVPSALMTIGMSPLAAVARPTGVAAPRRTAALAGGRGTCYGRDVPTRPGNHGKAQPNT
jgi:hypothetical protein